MALSATISMSPSTVPYNAGSVAVVTISNSGGSPVTLLDLRLSPGHTALVKSNQSQPITPLSIPAGGSAITTVKVVPVAPQVVPASSLQVTSYSIGANLITSDGSSFAATPATLTVSPPLAN